MLTGVDICHLTIVIPLKILQNLIFHHIGMATTAANNIAVLCDGEIPEIGGIEVSFSRHGIDGSADEKATGFGIFQVCGDQTRITSKKNSTACSLHSFFLQNIISPLILKLDAFLYQCSVILYFVLGFL